MQVQGVNNNYNKNYKPVFSSLIAKESAQKLIEQISQREEKDFKILCNRLSRTKFWDLRLGTMENNPEELWGEFVYKKNTRKIYKFGIYPFEIKDNKVQIYPIIGDSMDNIDKIKFSSPSRAQAMINLYKRQNQELVKNNFKSTNLQKLTRWTEQLEFLDEAYRYMKLGEVHPTVNIQNLNTRITIQRILKFLHLDN